LPKQIVSVNQAWTPAPPLPLLAKGIVHVWRAELETTREELTELLSAEERARGERLLRERDRTLWMRSRGVLRALIGRYLQTDGRNLAFTTGEHGKPALLADHSYDPPGLSFNLSHSGAVALYAFALTDPVGIDVELARRTVDEVAVAARILGPAAATRLGELNGESRQQEFLRLWVRHEAELKCLGMGIGRAEQAGLGEHRPWLTELGVGPSAAAALATTRAPRELHLWDWSPDT
jgi:4'-phosphopantetheinyl transferase